MEELVVGTSVWQDRSVLVTGATGLLGGWLVQHLHGLGADVVCLVRDEVPASRFMAERLWASVAVARGDVRHQATLERVISEYETSVVFHLAAQTIVPIANRNPVSTFETNVAGTWALLEACRRSGTVEAAVLASSDKAYGSQSILPYKEDAPLHGEHPYDVSKSCADLIGQAYAATWSLPVAIARCGNFFGGGDLNFNRLIPGTIRDVVRGRPPTIRSDGTCRRDYLYVEDGSRAYLRLAEGIMSGVVEPGRAYNFSLEHPLSVADVVDRVLAAMGSELTPVVLGSASNEIQDQYLDAARARDELGWVPSYEFHEGLERTIAWYRAHLEAD